MQLYPENYLASLLAVEQEMHFGALQSDAWILLTYVRTDRSRHFDYSNV